MEKEFLNDKLISICEEIHKELLKIDGCNRRIVENIRLVGTLKLFIVLFESDRDMTYENRYQNLLAGWENEENQFSEEDRLKCRLKLAAKEVGMSETDLEVLINSMIKEGGKR